MTDPGSKIWATANTQPIKFRDLFRVLVWEAQAWEEYNHRMNHAIKLTCTHHEHAGEVGRGAAFAADQESAGFYGNEFVQHLMGRSVENRAPI